MNRSRSWLAVTLVACGHAGSPGANAKLATQTSLPAISAPASAVPDAPVERPASQLEALQRGLTGGTAPAFHGAYEYRLRRLAKVYRRLLVGAA